MRIDVSQAQQYDKDNGTNFLQKIISDLSEQTGLSFSINKGFLEYEKDDDGNALISTDQNGDPMGSSISRDLIKKGIDHKETGKFSLVNSGGSHGMGLNFQVDVNQTESFIAGTGSALNKKTMGFGMMFTHEFLHTDIGIGKLHGREANEWGRIGSVGNIMNGIRKQMGSDYGERHSYLSVGLNGKSHIPFDLSNRQLLYQQIQGRIKRGILYPTLSPIRGKYISY